MKQRICRITGGTLLLLIGVAVAFGSLQIWNGPPASWSDVVADATTVSNVGKIMLVAALFIAVAGAAAALGLPWGFVASLAAVILFVIGGFWANFMLFADIRWMHTGANVLVGAIALALVRAGYKGRSRSLHT